MRDLGFVFVVFIVFSTIGWAIYMIADSYRRRQRLKAMTDLHSRIMDRMGSTAEFVQFLDTDGGRKLIDSMSIERAHPADKILRALQTGIIFTAVGIGFFTVRGVVDLEAEAGFTVLTALLLSLGIGFLLSALASWVMGKSFGLFDKPEPLAPRSFPGSPTVER